MSEATTDTREQAAARDLERAQRGVEEVLERIKDADERVGPEDLEKAESRVRFAKARLEGLELKKQEEAEQARRDRIDALKKRALALDPDALRKLEEKARKALDAYVAAGAAYRKELTAIVWELYTLEPMPDGLEIDLTPDNYGMSVGSERRATERPNYVCARMTHEILKAHLPDERTDISASAIRAR
jgi:hypothetical protein